MFKFHNSYEQSTFLLGLFRQELYLQTMNRRSKKSWRWIHTKNNFKKLKYTLTPESNDQCTFQLGRVLFTSTNVSVEGRKRHKLTTTTGDPSRAPNALLAILLCWAECNMSVDASSLSTLFGDVFIDSDQSENMKAIEILFQFVKGVREVLLRSKLLEEKGPNTLANFNAYVKACNDAEKAYSILQDWALNKPGGVLMAKLLQVDTQRFGDT